MSQQFSQSFLVKQESEEYKNQREERIRSIKNKLSAIPTKSTSDLHHNIFAGKQQTQVSTFSTRLSCRDGDYSSGQVQVSSQRNTAFELDDSRRSSFTVSSIDFNNKFGRHSARSGQELGEPKLRRFQIDAARLILDRIIKLSYRSVFDKISDYANKQQYNKVPFTSKDQGKLHKRMTHNGYLNQKENQSIEKTNPQANSLWPQERSSVSPRNRWSCRTNEKEDNLWRSSSPDFLTSKNYFKNAKSNPKDAKTNNEKWNNNIWDLRSNTNNNSQTASENNKMFASVEEQISKDKGILSTAPLSQVQTGKWPINDNIFNDNQSASLDARSKSVLTTAGSLNTIPKSFLESVSSSKKTQSQCSPSLGKALTQPAVSNGSKTQNYYTSQPYFLSQESETRPKILKGQGINNKVSQVDYNVLHAELEQKEVQSIERLKSDFQEIIKASFLEVLTHSRSGTEQSNEGDDKLALKFKQSPIKSARHYPGDQSLLNGAEIESIPCDDQELLERAMAGSSDDKMLFCAAQLQMEELLFEQAIHQIKKGEPDLNDKILQVGKNGMGQQNHGNQDEQQLEQHQLDQSLRSIKQMIFNGSFGAKREQHNLRQLEHESAGDLCISKVEQFSFEQKDDGIHDEISVIQSRTGREDDDIALNPFLNTGDDESDKRKKLIQEDHKQSERQWHSIMDSVLLSDSTPGISSQPVIVSMLLSVLEAVRLRQIKAAFLQILSSNREKLTYLNNYSSNHSNFNQYQVQTPQSSFQHPPQHPQQFTGLCYSNQFSTIIEQANETSSDMPLPLSISASKLLESHFLLESRNFDNLVEPTSISQSHNSHSQQQQQVQSSQCQLNQLEGRLSLLPHSPIAIETSFTVSENTPIVSPCRVNKSMNINTQLQLKQRQDKDIDGSDGDADQISLRKNISALKICQIILLRKAMVNWKSALNSKRNIEQGVNMIQNSLGRQQSNNYVPNPKNQLQYLQLCLFVLNRVLNQVKKRDLFRSFKLIELASWKRQAKEASQERFLLLTANLILNQQKFRLKEAFNQIVGINKLQSKQRNQISKIILRNKRQAFLLLFKRTKEHKAQELFITKGIKNILLMAAIVERKLADLQYAAFNKIVLQASQYENRIRLKLTADTNKENKLNNSNQQQKQDKYQNSNDKAMLESFKVNFLCRKLVWFQVRLNKRNLKQALWRISQQGKNNQEISLKGNQGTIENIRNGDDINKTATNVSTHRLSNLAISRISEINIELNTKRETRLVRAESSMQLIKCKLFVEILARLVKKHMVQIPFQLVLRKKSIFKQSKNIISSINNSISNNSNQSAQIPTRKMIRQPQKATFIVPQKAKKTPKKGNPELLDTVSHVVQYAGNGLETADKIRTNHKKTNVSQSQYISQKDRDLVCPFSPQANSRSTVVVDQTYSGARTNQILQEQTLSSSSRAKCITFGGSLSPTARDNNQSDNNHNNNQQNNMNIHTNTSEFIQSQNQQYEDTQGARCLDSHRNRHSSASSLPYFKHNRTKSGGNIHSNAGGSSSSSSHSSIIPQKQTAQSSISSVGNQFFLN